MEKDLIRCSYGPHSFYGSDKHSANRVRRKVRLGEIVGPTAVIGGGGGADVGAKVNAVVLKRNSGLI